MLGVSYGYTYHHHGQDSAFTRYSFTLRLLCTNQSSVYYLGLTHDLHCPRYCDTIARLLRNKRLPPRPLLSPPYTIPYWSCQYRVKAKARCTSEAWQATRPAVYINTYIYKDIYLSFYLYLHIYTVESRIGLKGGFGLTPGKLLTLKYNFISPQVAR